MSYSQRSVRLLTAVSILLAVALTGCVAPAGTKTPTTPSPTPTPTQPSVPQSGVPLTCADLAKASVVSKRYTSDTVSLAVDEKSAPAGFPFRAFKQGGGLHCVWGGHERNDGQYVIGMRLEVITDAASEYAVATSISEDATWIADRYGDHSKSFCSTDQGDVQCFGDVLVGTTWLEFRLHDAPRSLTVDQANSWADEQIVPAVKAISRAGSTRPAWTPKSAYDTRQLCDAATASAIAGAPVTVTDNRADTPDPLRLGMDRAATAECTWTSSAADANVIIDGLTGGAWALPGMTADPTAAAASISTGEPAQSVDIPGADGAFVADGSFAWGAVVAQGSLVEVFRDPSYKGKDNIPLMTRIVAYLDAHS